MAFLSYLSQGNFLFSYSNLTVVEMILLNIKPYHCLEREALAETSHIENILRIISSPQFIIVRFIATF